MKRYSKEVNEIYGILHHLAEKRELLVYSDAYSFEQLKGYSKEDISVAIDILRANDDYWNAV